MGFADYADYDGLGLAELVRAGQLTPLELVDAAIERIERSVERSRAEGETLHLTYCLLLLARAHERAGDASEGRAAVRNALAFSTATGQRYLEAELWRADAELARRIGDPEGADASLHNAIEVAESQGASGLAARARRSAAAPFPEGG